MYKSFVSEVDPKDVLDLLIQRRVISIERKDEVMSKVTRQDKCRALLDQLFLCSHDEAFLVLRQALNENYHWIVQRIDESTNNEVISLGDCSIARMVVHIFIYSFGCHLDRFLNNYRCCC